MLRAQMVTHLAEFFAPFQKQHRERSSAVSEIEAARNYSGTEKARFEDRLNIEFEVEQAWRKHFGSLLSA